MAAEEAASRKAVEGHHDARAHALDHARIRDTEIATVIIIAVITSEVTRRFVAATVMSTIGVGGAIVIASLPRTKIATTVT